MSITPLSSSGNTVQDVAQALMKNFDSDHDGRLSTDEFTGMLRQLLSGTTNASATVPNATKALTVAAETAPTNYSLAGFVSEKLNDPAYYSEKYSHTLKDQFLPAMKGLPPTTESLQRIVDTINAAGGKATVAGKDLIDFGDGAGPIDVIVDVDGQNARWWFQNTTGNSQWESKNH